LPLNYISHKENQALNAILAEGLNNGALALSEMLNKNIQIKTPDTKVIKLRDLPNLLGGAEIIVTGIFLRFQEGLNLNAFDISTGISGSILILFSVDKAFEITSILLSSVDYTPAIDPKMIFESALGEVGNITGSAVLNTISDKLKIPINPSPPAVVTDMAGSLLESVAATSLIEDNEIILIDTCFINESREIKGHFILLPDSKESILEILNKLGAANND